MTLYQATDIAAATNRPLLLGQIAWAYRRSLGLDKPDAVHLEFNERFADRLDVAVWLKRWNSPIQASKSLSADLSPPPFRDSAEDISNFESRFEAASLSEKWGVLAASVTDRDGDWDDAHCLRPVLHRWLQAFPAALPDCRAQCELIRLRARSLLLDAHLAASVAGPADWSTRYVEYVEQCQMALMVIDPYFRIGSRVRFHTLEHEVKSGAELLPMHQLRSQRMLGRCLERTTRFPLLIRRATGEEIDPPPELRETVFSCAYAGWRVSLTQQHLIDEADANASEVREHFFNTFRSAAFAAAVAGDFLTSAGLWHWYQSCLPDHLSDKYVHRMPPWAALNVRQAGLTVGARFAKPEPSERSAKKPKSARPTSDERKGSLDGKRLHGTSSLLERHREARPDLWEVLEAWEPLTHSDLPRYVYSIAKGLDKGARSPTSESAQQVLQILVQLLPQLGYINSMVDMLALLQNPGIATVLDVAHGVRRAISHNRFGWDNQRVRSWLRTIRAAWERSVDDESLTSVGRHQLHENLLGRYLSIKQVLSRPEAHLAARLMIDTLSAAEPSASTSASSFAYDFLLSNAQAVLRRGPAIVDPHRLSAAFERYDGTELGQPLMASIVALTNGTSIVTIDSKGTEHRWDASWRLQEVVDKFVSQAPFWFRIRSRNMTDQIAWPEELKSIARLLLQRMQCASLRTLLLAVDPELQRTPWQHLICCVAQELRMRAPVVSLIPSLGWFELATRHDPEDDPAFEIPSELRMYCQDNDSAVAAARAIIARIDKQFAWKGEGSMAKILGHGTRAEGSADLPTVMVSGKALDWGDWIRAAQRETVLIHSCWAGHGRAGMLGDIGSLVGLLLGGRCRAVIAPIGRIPVDAIEAAHSAVVGGVEREHVGARVLRAVAIEPAASLYTLHGDPYTMC